MAVLHLLALLAPWALGQVLPQPGQQWAYTVLLDKPSVGERLSEPPAKSGEASARQAAATPGLMRRAVARSQDPVIAELEARGIEVIGVVRNVLNAVFVRASASQVEAIEEITGVSAVTPGRLYEPMLASVSETVGVNAARVRPKGSELFGEGLKIAIIDSGLDFEHEAFQDESLPPIEGYPVGDPAYLNLASTKVVAVRTYVESLNSKAIRSSSPDDYSPRDRGGHGTGVAMIAAGNEVSTPVGPVSGIAPAARIGVYKVFGTPGLNFYTADHAVIMAIDDAVEDGMDILNLSLGNPTFYRWDAKGSDCGRRQTMAPCDPLAAAAHSAVEEFGRVVVVAAGNFGLRGTHTVPVRTSINSPGDVPAVVTVGQTQSRALFRESVQIGGQTFEAASGTGPDAPGVLSAPAVLAGEVGDRLACEAFPANAFLGRIAVIDRSECFFVEKVEHADAAGAVGVLVINHEGDDLIEMALLGDTDIPAFFVGGSDGALIREALAEPDAILTLDPTPVVSAQDQDLVAPVSARGPTLSFHLKPDLVAPGAGVYTAAPRFSAQGTVFSPSGFRTVSGTSFAAPVVSGAAALIWQAFPHMNAREVGSALINSAKPLEVEDGEFFPLVSSGAGLLNIESALSPTATVVPPSLGLGQPPGATFPVRHRLVIRNKSSRPQAYRVTVEPSQEGLNPGLTINGRTSASFRLGAHARTSLTIALAGTRPRAGLYQGRLRVASLAGLGDVLVPYLYVVPDNEPVNAMPLLGHGSVGVAGQPATKSLVARVLDQFGAPVTGRSVTFRVEEGGPVIEQSSSSSGPNGLIFASVRYPPGPEPQKVVATIGNLEIPFSHAATGSKPVIEGLANGANPSSLRGPVAGSLVVIRGRQFAQYVSGPPVVPGRPLPIMRKGVAVAFDAPDDRVSAAGRIHSVGEETVTVQVPWELAGVARAFVSVRSDNRSEPFEFELARVDPGIFRYESNGRAYAVAVHEDGTAVTPAAPARAGGVVTLSMTGNGPVQSPPATGEGVAMPVSTLRPPHVQVGGLDARVTYSGLTPELAGLYQLTLRLPASLPAGEHPVRVTMDGAVSNTPLLPVR